jgi:hypothetical protein
MLLYAGQLKDNFAKIQSTQILADFLIALSVQFQKLISGDELTLNKAGIDSSDQCGL